MDSSLPVGIKLRCSHLVEEGVSVSEVARLIGRSRKTLHKWLGRYDAKEWTGWWNSPDGTTLARTGSRPVRSTKLCGCAAWSAWALGTSPSVWI
jgi:IS30 family transposase